MLNSTSEDITKSILICNFFFGTCYIQTKDQDLLEDIQNAIIVKIP